MSLSFQGHDRKMLALVFKIKPFVGVILKQRPDRSSRSQVFLKIVTLKNFAIFTIKCLRQSLFLKKPVSESLFWPEHDS